MNATVPTAAAASPPSPQPLAGLDEYESLTRVLLVYIEQHLNVYLRFGRPVRTVQLDRWRRCAVLAPGAIFCRTRWEANDYGTTRWQLMVLQACTPLRGMQSVPGIHPGARILLHAEGERQVRDVLARIDSIEAQGIDADDVPPAYWLTLGNRLAARWPLPDYTADRHAAWLKGRALQ